MAISKTFYCQLADVCGHILIILANWCVTMSFVEANMWHFTAPGTSGFSLWAAALFVSCTCITPLFVCITALRNHRPNPEVIFTLSTFAPCVLLVVSSETLGESPSARTWLLGTAVALIPFVTMWVVTKPTQGSFQRNTMFNRFSCSGVIANCCITKEENKWKGNERLADEFLAAVFLVMMVRWCSSSMNVFYETWQAPSILLMFVLAHRVPIYVIQTRSRCSAVRTDNPSRKSTGSTVAENSEVTYSRSEKVVSFEKTRNPPDVTIKSYFSETSTAYVSNTFEIENPKCYTACYQISPSLPCRLGEKSPYPNGVIILVLFAIGVVIGVARPWNMISTNQGKKCSSSFQILRNKRLAPISLTALITILLASASAMIIHGGQLGLAFPGSCLICLILPTTLVISFDACWVIFRFQENTVFFNLLPGIVAWFTGLGFTLLHIAFILFINPKISLIFFGRMDVILGLKIALVSSASILSILIDTRLHPKQMSPSITNKLAPSSCSEYIKGKCRNNIKPVIIVAITLFVLCVGLAVGTSLSSHQCQIQHQETMKQFTKREYPRFSQDTLIVTSWNVQFGHDLNGRDNLPCIYTILNKMQPDIIGLQESDALPAYWGGKDILAYLKNSLDGMKEYPGVHPLKSSLGVGILTKRNVINHTAHILPSDKKNRKLPHYTMTHTEFRLNTSTTSNLTLHVFNLHGVFKNWTSPPLSNMSRIQLEWIADEVRKLDTYVPVIVMGDFNLNPFEPELNILRTDLDLKCSVHFGMDPHLYESTLLNRFAVVDHIFYRGLRLLDSHTLNETGTISDHHPVYARFSLLS
uniref:uncharacterized protein LOC100186503 isoform X2 n=1 Tax=Ciona intestinalis TaxID=7719 RepID=UPI000EF552E2|nr:uncharacterized protein LOC100186503 isoform X2 [Ciona intestinalis]|eukprot:XP_026694734.1 uncharacterized protein LOC100186503 isoform X2 [Ciona intestinalis]